ncbi:ATP-dependent protease ATPase subunit HslU [Halothermothrix orenii]|uniref:ATP-dependent protease ATPase subunit HslU n=1 Tax=Halothermothrix orenii (strain H 168 / OCM 544 / DSM 9562) TaxID=373903 RepID=B8CW45_HALOH|nr:ATP-dependent protease ATPase subunit HslU [Halothermothrix orenii]ACL69514.1 heat shock protein HslVU, ATPase subunit HslU [Halothermothrix orenii H 168]
MKEELTPRQIVKKLDKYIVGQEEAKKAVAIALRNRYRRKKIISDLQEEVIPKNILMIGPTGVGKTEIARRLARIASAPFIKVEVTKFTEVGYVGRDVESMVRDLVETAIRMVKSEKMKDVEHKARDLAIDRIVDIILPLPGKKRRNPFEVLFSDREENLDDVDSDNYTSLKERRKRLRKRIVNGQLDDQVIEITVESQNPQMFEVFSGAGVEEMGINFQDMFGNIFPAQKKKRKVSVKEAKEILKQEEAQKLIDMDEVSLEAIKKVENDGIIFLDEIDKIAGRESGKGPEVSREGVQRDILPIVEGSTVMTKYGAVKTDHILFIAAGAFHVSKPSDLIPELQGRFPIRVELKSLSREHFKQILLQPKNALTKQYEALIETEGIKIKFTDEAIEEIADFAYRVNEQTENIGARRLHTIMEKLLEDVSFNAPDMDVEEVTIDVDYVRNQLADVVQDKDLSKYIL